MSSPPTDQEVLAHVCKIIEMDDKAATFLEANRIKTVRRLTTTTFDIYQDLISQPNSLINSIDIGQVNLFRVWYTNVVANKGKPDNQDLVDMLTKVSWDEFCDKYLIYIQQQKEKALQTPQTPQTPTGGSTPITIAPSTPSLKVSLKDYPITTGKSTDWPRYQRKFIATATANGHEEILSPTYQRPSWSHDPD